MKWYKMGGCHRLVRSVGAGWLGMYALSTRRLIGCRYCARIRRLTRAGAISMPRKLPPHVELNHVKGRTYLSYRVGKGPRVRLPDDPNSDEFKASYHAAMLGQSAPAR